MLLVSEEAFFLRVLGLMQVWEVGTGKVAVNRASFSDLAKQIPAT